MNQFKQASFIVVILIAFWHCIATVIYVSGGVFTSDNVNKVVGKYMLPWFQQDWKLFAPEPPMFDLYLYYKVQFEDGSWSDWSDPGRELIFEYQQNRFSTAGRRYAIQDILFRHLWDDVDRLRSHQNFPEVLRSTHTYESTVKYYEKWAESQYRDQEIKALRFAMVNVHFNNLDDRFEKKRVVVHCLFPKANLDEF